MRRALATVVMVFVAAAATSPAKSDAKSMKDARKALSQKLNEQQLTAKVGLRQLGLYKLNPGGEAVDSKKQGSRAGLGYDKDGFRPGDVAKTVHVLKKGKERVRVNVWCCANRKHGTYVDIDIHFGRPVTADDLSLDTFITALSSLFDFAGHDPEAALAKAVEALNETPAVGSQAFDKPTVSSVTASVDPPTVKRGGTIQLMLEIEIGGPAGTIAEVEETRILRLDGRPLPGYPAVKRIDRAPGRYETTLPQRIPDSAPAGTYEFRGEVCVDEECVSRRRTFEVVP